MIAKASTICTYSLDPITLSPGFTQVSWLQGIYFSRLCHPSPQEEPGKGWSIQSLPCVDSTHKPDAHTCTPSSSRNRHTLLLQIVKEQPMRQPKPATSSPVKNQSQTSDNRLLGSNLFRLARLAGMPPFQASRLVEVNGIEPMTSCLQSTRSPS